MREILLKIFSCYNPLINFTALMIVFAMIIGGICGRRKIVTIIAFILLILLILYLSYLKNFDIQICNMEGN